MQLVRAFAELPRGCEADPRQVHARIRNDAARIVAAVAAVDDEGAAAERDRGRNDPADAADDDIGRADQGEQLAHHQLAPQKGLMMRR